MYVVGPITNVKMIQNRTANVLRVPPARHRATANSTSSSSISAMKATTKPGRD